MIDPDQLCKCCCHSYSQHQAGPVGDGPCLHCACPSFMPYSDIPMPAVVPPAIHSDTQLIFRWLSSMTLVKPGKGRWTRAAVVKIVFAVGSTSANQICRRHGFDPDEMVRKP